MDIPPALAEFFRFLTDQGYQSPRLIGEGRYAAILPFMYTHAIIVGKVGDRYGYDDRWCFHGPEKARSALEAWDGVGEPEGWHRHPATGRRRPEGIADLEYINP